MLNHADWRRLVKRALTNAAIYFIVTGAIYLLILASPEWIGFYGLILFYVVHFLGLLVVRPFYVHAVNESHVLGYFIDFTLITVNALVVFLITWFRRRRKAIAR